MKRLLIPAMTAMLFLGANVCAQPVPEAPGPGMEHPPPPGFGPMSGPGHHGPGDMPPGRGNRAHEDLRSLVQSVMMARVSRSLDLSDEQTVLLVRRFGEHQDAMMGLRKKRHGLMRVLAEAVEKGADDKVINRKLDDLIALDEQVATAPRRLLESTSKGLSAAQRAKLYKMLLEFESDLRSMVMRARQRHGFDGSEQGGRSRANMMRGGGEGRGNGLNRFTPDKPRGGGSAATRE